MKKTMLLTCVLLVCAMLSASCGSVIEAIRPAPKSPETLWARIGEAMGGDFAAYEMAMEMDMVMVVEGYVMESAATGVMIEDDGDDYYYYSETTVSVSCKELDMEQETRSISAYMDGKAFELRAEDGYERKLYSEMTKEEYLAYLADDEQEDADQEPDFQDCTHAEFAQNEDKTWTLTYSGYTKKAINQITRTFDAQTDVFGADIVDMQVTFKASEDFRVTDVTIAFEFDVPEDQDKQPALEIRLQIKAVGDGITRVTDTIDPAKYREVDDLAIRKEIDQLIKDRYEAEKGSFRYVQDQIFKVMGQTEKFTETDTVQYGVKDGKFYYDVKAEYDDAEMTLSYKNGTCTVVWDGESVDEPQTEEEARALIEMLINDSTYGYNAESITNIKDKGNGVWEIEQALGDAAEFEVIFTNMGGEYKSATQTITVTIRNDALVEIKTVVKASGRITSGGSIYEASYTLQMHTEFTD